MSNLPVRSLANRQSPSGPHSIGSPRVVIAAPTPPATAGLTVVALLSCARRRWKTAALLGIVLAALAATAVWMFLPPARPFAYTKLYFPARPAGSIEHPDPPVNQQTQKELITSRIVLRTVVEDPAIVGLVITNDKGDPISWLIRDLEIDFPSGSEIMRITLHDDRPDEAKVIIDKVAQAYMAKIGNESLENRKQHMRKLQEMVESARKDLDHDIDASKIGTAGGVGQTSPEVIAQRQQMINNEIIQANNEVLKLRSQLAVLRADEDLLNKRLSKTPVEMTAAEFEPVFAQNPGANRLKQIREELQAEYDIKSSGLGPENPTMVALKTRIDAAETRLESLRKELKTTIALSFQEKLAEDLRKKREEIGRLAFEEKAKLSDIQIKQGEFERLKDGTSNAARYRPGLTAKGTRLEDLQGKLSRLEMEMGAPIAVRQLEDEAVIVRPNDASRRMKMSTIAGVALFGFAFVVVGLLEFRANRLGSAGEVSQSLGLRLMGTVPARPRQTPLGMSDGEWEAVVNEAVDSTRTVFLHMAGMQNLRTVLVTSAVGGEGKTSLSVSLAASLARSGRRTLLIDADLRNPSVHGHFGLAGVPGVAEVLRGELIASAAVQQTRRDNLWVLPAGRCDARALGSLAQDEFSRVLAEVGTSSFDFVLIDTCPVLPVADALLVARHVDGVLMSLLVDVSQVDKVNAACQKLASVDVPLLGAVVNGTRGESFGYGYGYNPGAQVPALR
jgi:polysaccharide biosynthesis transport protein